MKKKYEYLWLLFGLAAIGFSLYLLANELKGVDPGEIWNAAVDRGPLMLACAFGSTCLAYAVLAWYDRIALLHVGKKLPWPVVSVVSFVAYALGHNIGVSILSAGLVRYRAYSKMGLNVGEVAIVTAFCAFTFGYGALFLGGIVLAGEPDLLAKLFSIPTSAAFVVGLGMLALVALYQVAALRHFQPLRIRNFVLSYPRIEIALRQLVAAPLEIIGAAGIIYFALPDSINPGFFVVLGVFLASFCAGLISNAPGGAGVFEVSFLAIFMTILNLDPAMPDKAVLTIKAQIIAALLMFRLLYLLIPLAISCAIVLYSERVMVGELFSRMIRGKKADTSS